MTASASSVALSVRCRYVRVKADSAGTPNWPRIEREQVAKADAAKAAQLCADDGGKANAGGVLD